MKLREILNEVPARIAAGDPETEILGVADHSRRVGEGFLFAAIEGHRESGRTYLQEAIGRGARAILSRQEPGPLPAGLAWIRTGEERRALAMVARNFHGRPDREVRVAGITGTNGKTTVSFLLESILAGGSAGAARIGTIEYRFAGGSEPAGRTTPSPVDLFRMLAAARDHGERFAVLEVSSHALTQARVAGLRFAAAVFTNLSRDHLDYHGDMESYFATKRILFEALPDGAPAVLNLDDPYGARIAAEHGGTVLTFGLHPDAWCRPESFRAGRDGIRARIRIGDRTVEIRSRLLGRVNLSNLLAAAAAATGLGAAPERIAAGLEAMERVPGRLEPIETDRGFTVLVDYAHTPDALEKLLASVRELEPARLIAVFGCGGDRDRGKRRPMGRAGAAGSDLAFLTSDNPRGEKPEAILEEVEAGAREAGNPDCRIEAIADRRRAICAALDAARPGDFVVIAGKGHETEQELATGTIPFDDREVVRAWLDREITHGAA